MTTPVEAVGLAPTSEPDLLSSQLHRRATRAMAPARLRYELRSIVLDVLGCQDPSELPEDVAAWAEHIAEEAASSACDPLMTRLLASLEATIQTAPHAVVVRLADAAARHDAGID
ncbi:MAG TPA: hypothetical protein VFV72_10490 [Candidatus Limnocylindrales bacterium]|nr:hypothetical protein [Candidatus Limnocylindrales bacterium]